MFNIGPGELMAILAVALIVLGPTRLPEAVRTVGRVVGELRRISSGFQDELRNAFDDSDVIDQLEKGPSARPAAAPGEPIDAASLGLAEPTPATAAGDGAEDSIDHDDLPDDDHLDAVATAGAMDAGVDDDSGTGSHADTEAGAGGDTGTGAPAPRPGTEDPPDTDQRAAS
jgi:sec-independent protein translocase protein TatB